MESPRLVLNYETVTDEVARILAQKSPGERLNIAFGMWRSARDLILLQMRHRHPAWSEARIRQETARRMSYGAVGTFNSPC